jgi:salicylate hydroxylase
MWVGPGRHLVCYPVRSAGLLSWGLGVRVGAERAESWTTETTVAEVLDALAGWNSTARALIGATDRPFVLPLYDRDPVPRLGHDTVTLLGDAAHPMLPFMAQGAAQAIEDGWVLARCMAGLTRPVPERLRLYEELRSRRVERIQVGSRSNAETFQLPDGAQQQQRDQQLRTHPQTDLDWLYGYDAEADVDGALSSMIK